MLEQELESLATTTYQKKLADCTLQEVYVILLNYVKKQIDDKPKIERKKKLYYVSAEFLIGKMLSNHLINLGIDQQVRQILEKNGFSLAEVEEIELEPSLGNGGLGHLAACFLDSIATLDLPGDGMGLLYHFGLFEQKYENYKQCEYPNPWIQNQSWLNRSQHVYDIQFKNQTVQSRMYELDVLGYHGKKNTLRLFDLETVDESLVKEGIDFDKTAIEKNLTLFLYPDDSDEDGKKLRVYQQYFMVSSSAQYIIETLKQNHCDLRKLNEYVTIQINDTHPVMIILELIRLLHKEGIILKEAISIVSQTCAYTNHTILAEALETWPLSYFEEIVPQLVYIIEALDAIADQRSSLETTAIIDAKGNVHMAAIAIHFGYSINGVAALHTHILETEELKDFYQLYPTHFSNKTNGITFRRWLLGCNRELSTYLDKLIGEEYKNNAKYLEKLLDYQNNQDVLNQIRSIKQLKKQELVTYLKEKQNLVINENSIFDIQVKRLHEYKRQQLNVLYIIYQYLKIKGGYRPQKPLTIIFGAKVAPAYVLAKDIIHTILCLQKLIQDDLEVNPYLSVVMVENYNVTLGEKLFPAADISEQISLASKEASGTGNMKFMLNGAVTLGTDDGANIEIHDLVGDDAIYIFGKKSEEVIAHYKNEDYHAQEYYQDEMIQPLVDFIISQPMLEIGDKKSLKNLYDNLVKKDYFMTLLDVKDYIHTKDRMLQDYLDQDSWSKKMLVNIAKAGYFSSDRVIKQYNDDIWKL